MAASRRTARARILLARRRAALQIRPVQAVTCPRCGQIESPITNADANLRDST
jgi:hypothetical protein